MTPWDEPWAAVERAPLDELLPDHWLRLDGDKLDDLPKTPPTLNYCIICRHHDSLAKWRPVAHEALIFLQPDMVAVLDARRRIRLVVVARRDLVGGNVITAEDVTTTRSSEGLGADNLPLVIGRRVAHDVDAGAAIDFGSIV